MRSRRSNRGAALVETALVAPVLILISLYGLYLGEVVRARLEVQEAARFAAWEATARTLSDPSGGAPGTRFAVARPLIEADAAARYRPLEQGTTAHQGEYALALGPIQVQLADSVPEWNTSALPEVRARGGGLAAIAAAASNMGADAFLRRAGFNLSGQVRADVGRQVRSRLVGLPALDALSLHQHLSLVVDGWALPDGADSRIGNGRAGSHSSGGESALHAQVSRMVFGAGAATPPVAALTAMAQVVPLPLPSLTGTFVVSHNYGPLASGERPCEGIPGYPSGAGAPDARHGLSNLASLADHQRPVCFDTAPFRDTQEYADSLYARLFSARGRWFMGCRNPQADDPSQAVDRDPGDRNSLKVECEGQP